MPLRLYMPFAFYMECSAAFWSRISKVSFLSRTQQHLNPELMALSHSASVLYVCKHIPGGPRAPELGDQSPDHKPGCILCPP